MRASRYVTLGCFLILLATTTPAGADKASDERLAADVRDAIGRFQEKDSAFEASLAKLIGYAVFPEVGKGAFIVGGARGRGEVYAGGKLIGPAQISLGTIGAQATANAADQGAAAKAKDADGVAIFILPTSGLMAEASIGGQKLKFSPLKE